MKRFYFGREEGEDDEDEDFDDPNFMMPPEFISMTRFENPDRPLFDSSIKICEKSLFWIFYGIDRKISMIKKVFLSLKNLTEGSEDAQV